MSADGASSVEGATVIKRDPLRVRYTIQDEFEGDIGIELSVSESDAVKLAKMGRSVVGIYLGHNHGPAIQEALKGQLVRLGVQYS